MTPSLLDALREKLPPPTDKAALEVAAQGSGVPFHTLLKIASGETSDPRASTLQKLLNYYGRKAA